MIEEEEEEEIAMTKNKLPINSNNNYTNGNNYEIDFKDSITLTPKNNSNTHVNNDIDPVTYTTLLQEQRKAQWEEYNKQVGFDKDKQITFWDLCCGGCVCPTSSTTSPT